MHTPSAVYYYPIAACEYLTAGSPGVSPSIDYRLSMIEGREGGKGGGGRRASKRGGENERDCKPLSSALAYRQHAIRTALSNPLSNILTAHLDCTSMSRRGSQLWSNNVSALQSSTSICRSHGSPETVTAPLRRRTAVFKAIISRFSFIRYVI